ncbi:variable surface protein VspJ [Brachyspira hyodysenteriae]|uniref:variable surface protein VspJ n=1 Tax=Brachyspira hyodysenteriae TaxID=159 RepID=UPI0022CD4278|nr:variable surface protein VspJ [Brachyspira hyodysenteriae]MCZ9934141.1 variable surface family protein [Brachyspira hyodysenteriae]MCZ9947331.1 variable surface family protein [Brachyspira hyodysenteriae]
MKRLYFILAALLITAYSAFSYTVVEDFNDFLVDENQLRIRLDRFGVLAGTENLRFMVGVSGETAGVLFDNLDNGVKGGINKFRPAAIAGFGYKTESFGIGAGYQFQYISGSWQAHTPIITATALNDNLRINIPVTIGVGSGDVNDGDMAVSTDIRVEYYTGNDIFSRIRVNLQYGMYSMKANDNRVLSMNIPGHGSTTTFGFPKDTTAHSIGIDVRGYFIAATDPVLIEPQIRLVYKASLKDFEGPSYTRGEKGSSGFGFYQADASSPVGAIGSYDSTSHNLPLETGGTITIGGTDYYITKPQFIGVSVPVGFSAGNDFINLYLEPALSFSMITGGINAGIGSMKPVRIPPVFYSVGYMVYGELYITPIPNLEWYFEAQIGGATTVDNIGNSADNGLAFNGSTGITWKF